MCWVCGALIHGYEHFDGVKCQVHTVEGFIPVRPLHGEPPQVKKNF